MSLEAKVYVDAIGVGIECNMYEDMTGAYDVSLLVRKPDGTEVEWTDADPGIVEVDGVDSPNFILYTTVDGDLDQSGRYKVQPKFSMSGATNYGNTDYFRVYKRYR